MTPTGELLVCWECGQETAEGRGANVGVLLDRIAHLEAAARRLSTMPVPKAFRNEHVKLMREIARAGLAHRKLPADER